MTFEQAYDLLAEMHGGHLRKVELALLALAAVDGRPLRAGSDVVDGARLVRARTLVERGVDPREALDQARMSEGLPDETTLDDCLRIGGLKSYYVDPYAYEREERT